MSKKILLLIAILVFSLTFAGVELFSQTETGEISTNIREPLQEVEEAITEVEEAVSSTENTPSGTEESVGNLEAIEIIPEIEDNTELDITPETEEEILLTNPPTSKDSKFVIRGDFVLYITFTLLLFFGLFTIMFKKNLIKIAIGANLIEAGVNLFVITLGYRGGEGSTAPIFTLAPELQNLTMVLPTPQALILTNIVIGLATTALMLTFAIITYKNNNTLDIRKLKGVEESDE